MVDVEVTPRGLRDRIGLVAMHTEPVEMDPRPGKFPLRRDIHGSGDMHLITRFNRCQRYRKAVRNKKSQVIEHVEKATSHGTGHGNIIPGQRNDHYTSPQSASAAPPLSGPVRLSIHHWFGRYHVFGPGVMRLFGLD